MGHVLAILRPKNLISIHRSLYSLITLISVRIVGACRLFILVICFSSVAFAGNKVDVDIEGIPKNVQKNIKILLSDLKRSDLKSKRVLNKKIRKAMIDGSEPLGFYNVKFTSSISSEKLSISVSDFVNVLWLPPEIQISGAAIDEKEVIALFELASEHVGETMTHEFYENIKSNLIIVCLNNGYLDAQFSSAKLEVSLQNAEAKVILSLDSGFQYRFAPISFEGGELSQTFLHKMTTIRDGDIYLRSQVEKFYQQLIDTQYFTSVKFLPQPNDDKSVTLNVVLESSPRYRYSTGLGFATDIGPRVKVGIERPWVNSKGHQLKVKSELSTKVKTATTEYIIPLYLDWVDSFVWSSGWQNKDVEGTGSEVFSTSFGMNRVLHSWVGSVNVNLENERYSLGDEPTTEVSYISMGTQWTRTRIWGNARNPSKGYKFWFSLETSSEDLGAETDFFITKGGFKWLHGLTEKQSLLLKSTGGIIFAGNIADLTATQLFYVGGDQTIRGYDYESLSTVDESGAIIGGQYLNAFGIEYRYQWLPKWQLSVFTDTGRAFRDSADKVYVGAGVGVRWISPIGPLNIDLAFPVNDDVYDGARLHVYMGPVI